MTILSCSLDPESRSRRLAQASASIIEEAGHNVTLIDLREWGGVPSFDNHLVFDDPRYELLHAAIRSADGIVVASPIYNWGLSSTTKSMIELTGATGTADRHSAWFDKLVTFICTGGLLHSYMAYGASAFSLMLDFKCIINPYLVYATERDWLPNRDPNEHLFARLRKALAVKLELAEILRDRTYRSDWEV